MPSTVSQQGPAGVQEAAPLFVPWPSDLALAESIAQAVRRLPGIVDLSAGQFVLTATYGPGGHVAGVVVLHPTETTLALQVHVVVSSLVDMESLYATPRPGEDDTSGGGSVLFRLADHVRSTVSQTVQRLGLPTPLTVDVSIDDIR